MKILLTNISEMSPAGTSDVEVTADLSRPDLVLEQIIQEKGVDFVLNALGEKALIEHVESLGYHVLESVKAA